MIEAQMAKAATEDAITQKQGVVGVGVGLKWVEGTPTQQPAVIVFVEKKRTKRNIFSKFSADDVVPESVNGVPTDVIEVGKIVKQGFTSKIRPIKPGYSTSHKLVTAGTIGGFFIDRDNDFVALSNNHVFGAENKGKPGDIIYQPGLMDSKGDVSFTGWDKPLSDLPYYGTLKRFVRLKPKNNNQDSAIVKLHPSVVSGSMVDPYYPTLNKVLTGFGEPQVNMQVQKVGRTTGYTTGRIIALNSSFTVGYDFGGATFNDCIVTTSLSAGGDSGSLILDMSMNAVGLLFAGSKKVTLASPIKYPKEEYGLQLWDTGAINDVLDFDDDTWKLIYAPGVTITKEAKAYKILSPAHHYAYLEHNINDFKSVSVKINTGSDTGATWGPGLVVQWPTGMVKVNLRAGHRFGGYYNSNENLNIGLVKPYTDYTVRITKTADTITGEVLDGGTWQTAIQIPSSLFPMNPTVVKVGKTCALGTSLCYSEPGSPGECALSEFRIE